MADGEPVLRILIPHRLLRVQGDGSSAGYLAIMLFFFSSRRRHTRLQGDWSSDVCSSDLSLRTSGDVDKRASSVGSSHAVAALSSPRAACNHASGYRASNVRSPGGAKRLDRKSVV